MLAAAKFPAGTEVLSGKYNIPLTVTITDGADHAPIIFGVDLDFLMANLTKKYAIGITVSSTDRKTSPYTTTILFNDPSFLVLSAGFTTSVSTRTVSFSNISVNGATYNWDFGDGTPASTDEASSHTYAAAGTHTIKLTTAGALGDYNKSTYTATVAIP